MAFYKITSYNSNFCIGALVSDQCTLIKFTISETNAITFNEEVTGNIALQTEDETDVGWIANVAGTKGTLEFVEGKELTYETVYVIVGKVSTTDGTETEIKITFSTKGEA